MPVVTQARASCAPAPQRQPVSRVTQVRTCKRKGECSGAMSAEGCEPCNDCDHLAQQDPSLLLGKASSSSLKKKAKKQKRKHVRAVLKGALRCQRGHKLKLQLPQAKPCLVAPVASASATITHTEIGMMQPDGIVTAEQTDCTRQDIDAVLQLLAEQAARRYLTVQARLRRRYGIVVNESCGHSMLLPFTAFFGSITTTWVHVYVL